MAKEYKDQILDTSVNTKRVYNIVDSDGNFVAENISFDDKTVYSQEGTEFGAQEVNEIYEAIEEVNQSLNDLRKMKLVGIFTESNQTIDVPYLASYSEIILAGYSEHYGLYGSEVFDIPMLIQDLLILLNLQC